MPLCVGTSASLEETWHKMMEDAGLSQPFLSDRKLARIRLQVNEQVLTKYFSIHDISKHENEICLRNVAMFQFMRRVPFLFLLWV